MFKLYKLKDDKKKDVAKVCTYKSPILKSIIKDNLEESRSLHRKGNTFALLLACRRHLSVESRPFSRSLHRKGNAFTLLPA